MSGSRLSLALFTSLVAILPNQASAQADPTPLRTCWRGRPQPACDVFWITELGFYPRLAGFTNGRDPAVNTHGSVELGRMVNHGRSARGVLVSYGRGYGDRYGLLLRHRRWLGTNGMFDLTGGAVKMQFRPNPGSYLEHSAYGVTADVGLGWRDYAHLSLRGDLLRAGNHTGTVVYGGLRLGSQPAVVAALTGGIILTIYVVSFIIGVANADF